MLVIFTITDIAWLCELNVPSWNSEITYKTECPWTEETISGIGTLLGIHSSGLEVVMHCVTALVG